MSKGLTYKQAGVDIEEANKFVKDIQSLVKKTKRPGVLNNIGGFGGCFELKKAQYKNPVLVSSADGVGTKIKIAMIAGKHDTVGIDLVAMNANDILAMGAEPLFFLDYIAAGKLSRKKMVDIVRGVSRGCSACGCALIGGETAEMPAIYKKDEYDLAGFCVGVVEKNKIITGSGIRSKDVLLGLASSGLHSNGFSLVHKVFTSSQIKRKAKELLIPTKIYVKEVLSVLRHFDVRGIAHITGGAFYEKLMKIFPKGSSVVIKKGSWPVPAIFRTIQERADIKESEMYRTFNMGIGMVLVTSQEQARKIQSHLSRLKLKSWIIGEVSISGVCSNIKFTKED
ncbi:MAG: phosphoribosylformylglycinamidine cyclo-ligase [Candidatus Omnitrophica bacterium]|nr:phosphoribosylformylglycinamidine cyclo-ligase [Candidatus Omnitrophota bacterium]